ncbi:MAG TPA: hypothetical protein EYG89_03920 [Bacteroidia bacterium]|nr:hypothetical protein [Bacteroidia bacterium]
MASFSNSDLRVLIIDDIDTHMISMKDGLRDEGIINVYPGRNKENKLAREIEEFAANKNQDALNNYIENILLEQEINLLFLDLQLTREGRGETAGNTSGERFLQYLSKHSDMYMRSLPIVIVSKYSNADIKNKIMYKLPFLHIHQERNQFNKSIFSSHLEEYEKNGVLRYLASNYINHKADAFENILLHQDIASVNQLFQVMLDLLGNGQLALLKKVTEKLDQFPEKKSLLKDIDVALSDDDSTDYEESLFIITEQISKYPPDVIRQMISILFPT